MRLTRLQDGDVDVRGEDRCVLAPLFLLQEEFDTKLMQLPWNEFVAGDRTSPEDLRAASVKVLPREREAEIAAWYESCVGEVPMELGRLVSPRTNISYDQRLRRRYGSWLLGITLIAGLSLWIAALVVNPRFSDVILGFAVPYTPVLAWALREHRKQLDTATTLHRLQSVARNRPSR